MWKSLETAVIIWKATTKAFDKMDNDEKIEWFNDLIDDLEDSDSIKWLQDKWNTMTDEQKLELYKRQAVNVSYALKNWSWIYQLFKTINSYRKNKKKNWKQNALNFTFLEKIPCRFLIQLWVLEKPKEVTNEQLFEDTKKDAKHFNRFLSLCNTVCACIPEARSAVPFITMAKHYTKWYEKEWTKALTARLEKQQEIKTEEQKIKLEAQTQKELFETMWDVAKAA